MGGGEGWQVFWEIQGLFGCATSGAAIEWDELMENKFVSYEGEDKSKLCYCDKFGFMHTIGFCRAVWEK